MDWEVGIIEWTQRNLGGIGTTLGKVFSFIGGEMGLLILLIVVLFCWKKEVGQRLALIVATVAAWPSMLKSVVARPRPYVQYPDRVVAMAPSDPKAPLTDVVAQGYSFPSTHSGSAVAACLSLACEVKKRWFWFLAIALAFLMGLSRVATGNHYPTDVLAGWALGIVVVGIFELLEQYVQEEWIRHLILLAVTLPGLVFVRTSDYFTSLGVLVGAIASIPFERKYVGFQDTRNAWAMVLRVLGSVAIYFGLNKLLKMPFSAEFLGSASLSALLVRTVRYAIIMFVIMGVYPKAFPLFEKLGNKDAGDSPLPDVDNR